MADGGSEGPGNGGNHFARVLRRSCRDVTRVLVGQINVHQIAEAIISLIFWPSQPFYRVSPDVNDTAVRHGDQPVLRDACEIHRAEHSHPVRTGQMVKPVPVLSFRSCML
jgi:hypothetical protein